MLLEEVERDDVGAAVRVGRAEPHGAEEAREEGDVVVVDRLLPELSLAVQLPDHVQAEDVRLSLLERAVALLEGRRALCPHH